MGLLRRVYDWVNRQAWLLLTLTTLIWGGNVVASRLAVGEVSPMMLVALRWLLVFLMLAAVAREDVARDWPKIGAAWPRLAAFGALGYTGFNLLFYAGAHYTSGVNLAIIQGSTPIFIMLGAAMAFAQRFMPVQWIGMAVTVAGVLLIATQGDPTHLASLTLNRGDVYCLIASVLFAGYSLGLRDRPPISPLALFAAMAFAAVLASLPFAAWEMWSGAGQTPTLKGWVILAYIAVGPSFLSQLMYMRGVALIGPARAAPYYNLTPVFGALLSVLILREPFHGFHAAALAMVLAGIWLSERKR